MREFLHRILMMITALWLGATPTSALDFLIGSERGGIDGENFGAYSLGLLKLALEKADGDHTIAFVDTAYANQERLLNLLASGNADFHLMISGIDQHRHDMLATVPVPLQRGLLGHRILIVSEDSKAKVANVTSMEDLKRLSIGSGTSWPDTKIMAAAGLNVQDAPYESLFKMVALGRLDGFARGAAEAFPEVAAREDTMPNLSVDPNVMIVYPFDDFIFLNKDDIERYDIILQGLKRAYEDGSFMAYFNSHPQIREVFEQAGLDERIRFEIDNPLLPPEIAAIPDQYWHGR
ncbi:hypothetical protein GCM10011316_28290 [Roseibium aquae]|uniref:Uncharacterized protein n=1 Tax=Roseibium aquae TaxID=1323746 RepID=A0A916TNT1_9HYPH|nr:amino acid ABC transporter substrate-binding protein [Roseibium aquae]GGB54577.1 hypothetical protein GCM10011316_28290 [Roseibium aquae]